MNSRKKGYTLIELICSYFLIILIFVTVFTLFAFVVNTSSHSKDNVITTYTADNLKERIKNELSSENVSLVVANINEKVLEYEKFSKIDKGDEDYMGGKGHKLSKKKIKYDSHDKKLILITQNDIYKEKNDQVGFKLVRSKETSTNILEENVEDFAFDYKDEGLYFEIRLKKNEDEEKISFNIRGVKKRELI